MKPVRNAPKLAPATVEFLKMCTAMLDMTIDGEVRLTGDPAKISSIQIQYERDDSQRQ